ncbi:ANR family transcriptional regulator [Enterobacter roggenkampii]|uniref:ANR family transcriptional regulator n=1 Tax=Enterobacter roggenkampii TaxID=1812935 RepID=UPI003516B7EF
MASAAAAAERSCEWQYAAGLWEQAETLARQALNREWSAVRMQFCRRRWRYASATQLMYWGQT